VPASSSIPSYWVDSFAGTSVGTTAVTTTLNAGNNYIVPGKARSIVALRPKAYILEPTADVALLASLNVISKDLGLGPYEVFCQSGDAGLGTTESFSMDESIWYPANWACGGGEQITFQGTAEIANAAGLWESLDILLSDTVNAPMPGFLSWWNTQLDLNLPVQAKVGGLVEGSGPTATSATAAVQAQDSGTYISGVPKYLKALYGALVETTPAADKPFAGYFQAYEPSLAINPQTFYAEPINGLLGTTTANNMTRITRYEGLLNLFVKAPAHIFGRFFLDQTVSTAGKFELGYLFQDQS